MSTITTIAAGDLISGSRTDINTNFANLNSDKIETSVIDTDTTLAADSDSKLATQKAVKAYTDSVASPVGKSWNEYAIDSVGTDSYAITVAGVTSYVEGQTFKFKAGTANTGACSLNVNGLGAKTIKKDVSSDLATGDILQNQIVTVIYDGTNMSMLNYIVIASTTQKGIVEEATQADVEAGTATGETGARLFINPSTQRIPSFQQDFPTSITMTLATGGGTIFGSNSTGSVFFIMSDGAEDLFRFERDANTGQFIQTHTINPTLAIAAGDQGAIIVIGNYIYIFTNDGTNIICSRFLAADLTGEQVMTVPVVSCTSDLTAWTDGTYAYIVSAQSDTTSRKWSLSGTTFTAVSTAVVADLVYTNTSSMWDGTSAYIINIDFAPYSTIIYKLTNIDGSTKTTIDKGAALIALSDTQAGGFILPIDTLRMYIGFSYYSYNEVNADAVITSNIRLYPVSKP